MGAKKIGGLVLAFMLVSSLAAATGGHDGGAWQPEFIKDFLLSLVNFVLLVGILALLLRKPLKRYLVSRRSSIESQMAESARLRDEAREMLESTRARMESLEREVEEILRSTIQEAEAERERILAESRKVAARIEEDARAAMAHELKSASTDMEREILEKAVAMAREILSRELSPERHRQLIDDYIGELTTATEQPRSDA